MMTRNKAIALTIALVVGAAAIFAQRALNAATPKDNDRIQPFVAAEKKALEAFNKKVESLPETKALRDAQAAYNKAVEGLPENAEWKKAGGATLDMAYKIMAEKGLSSREYRPQLNAKGDLEFVPIKTQ
jgi:methionyl-tRNA synthetase